MDIDKVVADAQNDCDKMNNMAMVLGKSVRRQQLTTMLNHCDWLIMAIEQLQAERDKAVNDG